MSPRAARHTADPAECALGGAQASTLSAQHVASCLRVLCTTTSEVCASELDKEVSSVGKEAAEKRAGFAGLPAMGSQQWDGGRKRKLSSTHISELEEQISKLRRQESTVARHLARLGHETGHSAIPSAHPPVPLLNPFDSRVKQIRENQVIRVRAFWNDVRKEIRRLLKMSLVSQWFGIPVKAVSYTHLTLPTTPYV